MDRLYKRKLADAVSPHTSGNSARPPMDQCNYERNTSGLSFLCDYVNIPREIASILFIDSGMGAFILNQAAFGELVIIIRHIEAEPVVAPKPIAQAISQQPKSILTQPQNPVKNTPKIDLSSVKIGSMLTHKAFGAGAVKAIDDKYITVDFDGMENRFMFPAAIMQGFLKPQ